MKLWFYGSSFCFLQLIIDLKMTTKFNFCVKLVFENY